MEPTSNYQGALDALSASDDSEAQVLATLAVADQLAELVAIASALVIDRTVAK